MAKKTLFRKVALERLSSPDQLDLLMKVTSPREWIALVTFLALVVVAITWGFLGQIPTKVEGRGILIKTGGVVDILAKSEGQLTTLYVEKGDIIDKGDPIARVDQAGLIDELSMARKQLEDLEKRKESRAILYQVSKRNEKKQHVEEKESIRQAVRRGEDRLRTLKVRINEMEQLVNEGLVTKQPLQEKWQEYSGVEKEIEGCAIQLNELEIQKTEEMLVDEAKDFALNQEIKQSQRKIETLEFKLDLFSKIDSPFQGKIIDIETRIGNLVKPGDQLLSLEKTDRGRTLELVLYVSPREGKKIKKGKLVQVSPSTVKREEYGYVLGLVTSVSDFPSSRKSMMQVLNNEQLVDMFSVDDAPVAVYANLIPAPHTKPDKPEYYNESGYKWSSPNGPPIELKTGTLCSAEITITNARPLSFVIPGFDKLLARFSNESPRVKQ